MSPPHEINLLAGWMLVLAAFVSGAGVGLGFHRPKFLGGYGSLRRRMVRLGHIAFAALGMINVLYGLTPFPAAGTTVAGVASIGLIVGGVAMPAVCFLTAWREPFRHLFFIPVASLVIAVGAILYGGLVS
jgi:hypothetical protein